MAGKRWREDTLFRFLCADPAKRSIWPNPLLMVLVRVGEIPYIAENNSTVNQHWRIKQILPNA